VNLAYRSKCNMSANTFTPGPTPNTVLAADGKVLTTPDGWVLLPPVDEALIPEKRPPVANSDDQVENEVE
jgi:hypothetical protein